MKKHIFIWMILLMAWANVQAQEEWTIFQSPEQVNDFVELGDYFWLATNSGVVRLHKEDKTSQRWTILNSNLPSSHIQSITIDQSNQIWIGTYDLMLARWTGSDWEVLEVSEDVISENHIRTLYTLEIDESDNIWIGSTSGLIKYDGENWQRWHQSIGTPSLGDVWSIAFGENGETFFASFFAYKMEGDSIYDLSQNDPNLFAYGDASLERYEDGVWFIAPFNSIAFYQDGTWEIYPFFSEEHWDPVGPFDITSMTKNPQGELLVTTDNGLLYRFTGNQWVLEEHPQIEATTSALTQQLFHYDEHGNSWLFKEVYYSELSDGVINTGLITDLEIRNNQVKKVIEAPDGRIVVFNDNKNLDQYHNGEWTQLSSPLDTATGWNYGYDVAFTSDNRLWLSSNHGLFVQENEAWTKHTESSGYPLDFAFRIAIGPNDEVWVSSDNELAKYNGTEWTHYTPQNSPLTDESIKEIIIDQNGIAWVSTFDEALHRIEGEEWTTYTSNNSILPYEFWPGWGMHVDLNNNVWVPLGENGALRIKPDNTWTIIGPDTPMEEAYVRRVISDSEGNLIFQTNYFHEWDGGQEWTLFNDENTPITNYLTTMHIDANNNLWCGNNDGVFVRGTLDVVNNTDQFEIIEVELATASPNPGLDEVNIHFNKPLAVDAQVSAFNLAGQSLLSQKVQTGNQDISLNTQTLPSGFYLIQILHNEEKFIIPWVKK